jgi:hypothetical protein
MSNPIIKAEHLYEYQSLADEKRALIALAADGTGVNSLTNNVGYWDANGVFQTIFTPSVGAFDPRMVDSRDYAYFTDGVAADEEKWNLDTGLSKWGLAAPTTAASVSATSGSTDTWVALTTYTTMGLLTDQNNNIEQLISTNANSTNPAPSHIGTSGVGTPNWNQASGGTTTDGPITWTNRGPIGLWQPNTLYNNESGTAGSVTHPSWIYDPATNSIYGNGNGSLRTGTSGSVRPSFTGINGQVIADNGGDNGTGIAWFCVNPIQVWQHSHAYNQLGTVSRNDVNSVVSEPSLPVDAYNTLTGSFNATIYLQTAGNTATSSASFGTTTFSTVVGGLTDDNQLQWLNLGSKTWVADTAYTRFQGTGQLFSVIYDGANYQVALTSGTSGGTIPSTWGTKYGDQTTDGSTLVWVCVGPALSWTASTKWFLGANGWSVPTSKGSYAGATILDNNGDIETVISSGLSQTPGPPTWGTPTNTTTDGTITWYNLGVAPTGAGDVTLVSPVGRQYFIVFINPTTGNISDLSPVSVGSGTITNGEIFLGNLPVSTDPQVTMKIILATADGGDETTLYFVAEIPNATLTYVDTTPEAILLAQNVYQYTDPSGVEHGVADNDPPPNGSYPIKYRGRLYLLVGSFLYFSKSLAELTTSTGVIAGRYEEDWPPDYQMDISEGAEIGRGLFTDGYVLYIGTQRHIRRIQGDGPTNFTSPEIIFNEVGIANQDVWQAIFQEGTPAGAMWMTPDFRVIRSDFNTYQNVGTPIQNTLNTINGSAVNNSWASYVGINGYNFYVLAIPTGTNTEPDTLCVYNILTGMWFIWTPADLMRCALYCLNLAGVPRFIVNANDGSIYLFDPSTSMDRATGVDKTGITSVIRTGFTDMNDATLRKALNEVEVGTTQTGMLCTVEGASSQQDFVTPTQVVVNAPLVQNFLGELKLFLAGLPSHDRFYRLTLTNTSTASSTVNDELLSYYSYEAYPLHRN